jgi:4-oxalocrotonate tautomerase
MGSRRENMPTVFVYMWPGRDDSAKRRIAEGITKVFESEKVPRDAVEILMTEIPKNHWAHGGKLYSD